jgi:hypothetical protein
VWVGGKKDVPKHLNIFLGMASEIRERHKGSSCKRFLVSTWHVLGVGYARKSPAA